MIIHESLIELHIKSKDKNEIIETLAGKAKEFSHISDVTGFVKAVFAFDESFPNTFGYGIAIPYAKSSYVLNPFIAFARSEEVFMWDSRADHEARLIFLIGVPEGQEADLEFTLLLQMYGCLTNESYRRRLLEADSITKVMAVFAEMGL